MVKERYLELASSHTEYYEAIKSELLNEIADLVKERNALQNKILTMETADEKANEIVRELKRFQKIWNPSMELILGKFLKD